ncbi:unnamed protein product [Nippostrongylus brasiliensis]|uniref:C-CAP/cofactor C-like domain-containing protein n=1 Tax=Nippostrongylus brasiliensis TaxID=27835 RepID=A0A0N4YGG2_NIPBR|nr:unnamed protein product [Nippostrongylus brasiliensis]
MTIRVWVWLRGETLLDLFLPLSFQDSLTPHENGRPPPNTAIENAHKLIDECDCYAIGESAGQLTQTRLTPQYLILISEYATLTTLALQILFLGMESYEYKADESAATRGDVITAMVHEQMDHFIGVFGRCAVGCSREALKTDQLRLSEEQLKKFLASLDHLFEGMAEDDESNEGHDEIVQLSYIIRKLWLKNNEISLRKLIGNIRRCLVQDPFQIDDLAVDTPSCSPRRVTSLTNTRRKVTVAGWQRFQLLSKAVYKDVHLRITSNKSQSMFVGPWRCRSIIVDNVKSCPAIVLGPTRGAVILREVHDTNVTVACRRLYLWKCSRVNVFLHSFNPPVVRECAAVQLGPFNVSYEGLSKELAAADLRTIRYKLNKHVINFDNSSVSTMPPEEFYIQPVPIVNGDDDVEDLLEKLPSAYRSHWESTVAELKSLPEVDDSAPPLRRSDMVYLRGKIVKDK